ncbi:SLC26A/SulP transporter family protein [Legionella erythra]|uniref:Sulfate transporter n=1 Tax=Legionella erythra TaxID=448 RepID=A0A0W0TG35_LEGER|nr:SulP family inorganic anion transporter [Legionella erythra]KTC94564.1 sulfate transporter [Legionella erythra]
MNTSKTSAITTVFAGLLLGTLVAVDCLSYASLIFSGSLSSDLLYGISAGLLGSGILLILMAWFSSSRYTIAASQDIFAIITALVAASLAQELLKLDSGIDPLPTVMMAIVIMSLLLGLTMYGLGVFRLGKLVRYIPYPVIGGFLAGTGWLLLVSTLQSIVGGHSTLSMFKALTQESTLALWILPAALGGSILILERLLASSRVFPAMVILSFLGFYLYLLFQGFSLGDAKKAGLMLGPFPEGQLPLWPSGKTLNQQVQWHLLFNHMADYFALAVLGMISMLLNISSFEISSRENMDINRELKCNGLANGLIGLGGGLGGYHILSFSKTNLHFRLGQRAVGILAGIFCLLLLIAGAEWLTLLPKFIFSALLLYVAFDFLLEWLVTIKKKISWLDYLIVLMIMATIVFLGLLTGIVIGLLLSLAIFFFRYSRIPVVSSMLSADVLHSHVERNEADKLLLEQHGNKILIVNVRGYLFFGNAYDILNRIRKQLDKGLPCDYLIINFNQVTGIEVSGALSFINLLNYAQKQHVRVLFTHLPRVIEQEIQRFAATEHKKLPYKKFADLDHALEWCENALMRKYQAGKQDDYKSLFNLSFPEIKQIDDLLSYGERLVFSRGSIVCEEGEETRELFWIAQGELEIILGYGTAREKRLRRLLAGTIVGEMAFYLNQPRTASVVAAHECLAYRFTAESLGKMTEEQPELAAAFHKGIVKIIAKRLFYANRLLANDSL